MRSEPGAVATGLHLAISISGNDWELRARRPRTEKKEGAERYLCALALTDGTPKYYCIDVASAGD